ncbi:uroporphyrinogen decarboxylase family protein, partial [Candidatus Latescibacterota bacterium]
LLAAFRGEQPDRLPATTHHVMPYFLNTYMNGMTNDGFFDHFDLDPVLWVVAHTHDKDKGEYQEPGQGDVGFLEAQRASSDNWRIKVEELHGYEYTTHRYSIVTPKKTLTTVLQSNEHTTWIYEHLIKEKSDIDVIGEYATSPLCNVEEVNHQAEIWGDRGIVRGHICCFDIFGQPGCWQDAACLVGIEKLIMATFDDPEWVHALLTILRDRKMTFARSLEGAKYDVLELGGGDACTTVISPDLFNRFVAPYDSEVIVSAHEAGQRIAYHTCGGIMPILEDIADMGPDAMETFTPTAMGGDVDLREAKRRIGDRVCMIGGFDQYHFFTGCAPEDTRREVRRCFEDAGYGGGYIISPSDHFFDAEPTLIQAFSDEAGLCRYSL